MATRRAHDDFSPGAYAQVDGVVGGNVAGMQGDHHVQRGRMVIAYIALLVVHALQAQSLNHTLTQLDKFVAQLHTSDPHLAMQGVL